MRWPGKIPAGATCSEPLMTIDVFPTIAGRMGGTLPDHPIDGRDIWPLMSGQPDAKNPHEALFFYWGRHLQSMRSGKWKLHFPHAYRTLAGEPGGKGGKPTSYSQAKTPLALFDLSKDISQTTNVADKHPDVVKRLQALADTCRNELGDSATKKTGKGARQPGRI